MHEIIRGIADDDRAYDPWGAGMAALGAVCDVLHEYDGEIPESAEYRPGVFGPDLSGDAARTLLAGMFPERFPGFWVEGYRPDLTLADLEHAARVLSRYLDWVCFAGRNY